MLSQLTVLYPVGFQGLQSHVQINSDHEHLNCIDTYYHIVFSYYHHYKYILYTPFQFIEVPSWGSIIFPDWTSNVSVRNFDLLRATAHWKMLLSFGRRFGKWLQPEACAFWETATLLGLDLWKACSTSKSFWVKIVTKKLLILHDFTNSWPKKRLIQTSNAGHSWRLNASGSPVAGTKFLRWVPFLIICRILYIFLGTNLLLISYRELYSVQLFFSFMAGVPDLWVKAISESWISQSKLFVDWSPAKRWWAAKQ